MYLYGSSAAGTLGPATANAGAGCLSERVLAFAFLPSGLAELHPIIRTRMTYE